MFRGFTSFSSSFKNHSFLLISEAGVTNAMSSTHGFDGLNMSCYVTVMPKISFEKIQFNLEKIPFNLISNLCSSNRSSCIPCGKVITPSTSENMRVSSLILSVMLVSCNKRDLLIVVLDLLTQVEFQTFY